jgi:hypothetical protein
MKVLGITWTGSVLITFDPMLGAIVEKHAWLNPAENFVGLAYDSNRNLLFALSQVAGNLYSINPLTRDVKLIGMLNTSGRDVSGLSYDPVADVLYTVVLGQGSDLAQVSANNAAVTVVGKITDGLALTLCWRESDGQLNSYVVYGSGSSDSPYKADMVSIDPATGTMTTLFHTPYHTILGLARTPGQDAYVSWVNASTHFYADVNLATQNITALANSDPVRVESGAMLLRNFYVAPAPNLPPCSFSDDDCLGRSN